MKGCPVWWLRRTSSPRNKTTTKTRKSLIFGFMSSGAMNGGRNRSNINWVLPNTTYRAYEQTKEVQKNRFDGSSKLNNTTTSILPKGGCSNLNLPLALKSQKEWKANLDLDRKDGDGGDALILFVHQEKSNITPTSVWCRTSIWCRCRL